MNVMKVMLALALFGAIMQSIVQGDVLRCGASAAVSGWSPLSLSATETVPLNRCAAGTASQQAEGEETVARDPAPASSITIASATITPSFEPSLTRAHMQEVIERTLHTHPEVRLILFGEVILGWFGKKGETREYHESIAEPVPGPSTQFFADLARRHGVYISFGLSERDGDAIYNTQVLVSPEGELLAKHRKFWVFNPAFTPGEQGLTLAEVDGAKLAILVCADVRSLGLLRQIRRENVDIVLAALADYGTDASMSEIIGTFFDAWAFTANRCGKEDAIEWHGVTTITDRWGRLVQVSLEGECVLIQEISLERGSSLARFARRMLTPFRTVGLILSMLARRAWASLVG